MVTHQQWKTADTRYGPGDPSREQLYPGVTDPGIHDVGGVTGSIGERLSADADAIILAARKFHIA